MPKEQLLGLADDVDRLLAAGAAAAIDNETLARRARTLRELSHKVPALAAVADAVERVVRAEPRQAGPAFLDLLQTARQLRASLALCGVAGEAEPIAESGPWRTPLSERDLRPLVHALTTSGGGREATLRDAASHGVLGDMRLAAVLLGALGDSYAAVADLVADEILPSLGKAMLPELLSRFEPSGKAPDARRLRAVCKIDHAAGADLCRRTLGLEAESAEEEAPRKAKTASAPVRVQALQSLPDVVAPEEAEQIGLRLRGDRNGEVKAAALAALRTSGGDAALDALTAALLDPDHALRQAALNALTEMPHPGATARLIRELEPVVAALRAPPDGGKGATEPPVVRARAQLHAACLITALGRRKWGDRAAAARALIPLADDADPQIRQQAFQALTALGPVAEEVVPVLEERLRDLQRSGPNWAVMRALSPFVEAYPDRLGPSVLNYLKTSMAGAYHFWPFVQTLTPLVKRYPGEVVEVLRRAAHVKNEWHGNLIAEVLTRLAPAGKELLPDLVLLLRANRGAPSPEFYALFARLDDGKTALPLLIDVLSDRADQVRLYALQALAGYGPRARLAAAAVSSLVADPDMSVREAAKETLQAVGAGPASLHPSATRREG
jgi:HEAT repeat protein